MLFFTYYVSGKTLNMRKRSPKKNCWQKSRPLFYVAFAFFREKKYCLYNLANPNSGFPSQAYPVSKSLYPQTGLPKSSLSFTQKNFFALKGWGGRNGVGWPSSPFERTNTQKPPDNPATTTDAFPPKKSLFSRPWKSYFFVLGGWETFRHTLWGERRVPVCVYPCHNGSGKGWAGGRKGGRGKWDQWARGMFSQLLPRRPKREGFHVCCYFPGLAGRNFWPHFFLREAMFCRFVQNAEQSQCSGDRHATLT